PIGKRHVLAAIERLEEPHHAVGVIELEVDLLEEILAQDEVHAGERPLAAHPDAQVLAHHVPDPDLLDPRGEDAGSAAEAAHPFERAARLEAEALCRGVGDEAEVRTGIDEHPDLLAVDLALDDRQAAAKAHRPFGDPHELALGGLRGERGAGEHKGEREDDRSHAPKLTTQNEKRLRGFRSLRVVPSKLPPGFTRWGSRPGRWWRCWRSWTGYPSSWRRAGCCSGCSRSECPE